MTGCEIGKICNGSEKERQMRPIDNYLKRLEPIKYDFARYKNYFKTRWDTFQYAMQMLENNGIELSFAKTLEIGCGSGYYLSLLSQVSTEVIGVDIAGGTARTCEAGYANAKKLLNVTGTSNVIIRDGAMEKISVEDNSIDLVFSAYVLEHVMDLDAGMKECNRVLGDKGIMVSIVPGVLDKMVYIFSRDYLKHSAFSALRPFLYLLGIKRDLEASWHFPLAPWPHDVRKTFFQELNQYRLKSWLGLFHAYSHRVVDIDRCRLQDHIIISRKDLS